MRFIVIFVTAVCVLFLIKLRWPKKKNFYSNNNDVTTQVSVRSQIHVIHVLQLQTLLSTFHTNLNLKCIW